EVDDRDRDRRPAEQLGGPQPALAGDQRAVGPDHHRVQQPEPGDAGRERGDIAHLATRAFTDADGIERDRGAGAAHDSAPTAAMMAVAASRIVANVPSERSSESNASKPSLPRARMKPAHVLPSVTACIRWGWEVASAPIRRPGELSRRAPCALLPRWGP